MADARYPQRRAVRSARRSEARARPQPLAAVAPALVDHRLFGVAAAADHPGLFVPRGRALWRRAVEVLDRRLSELPVPAGYLRRHAAVHAGFPDHLSALVPVRGGDDRHLPAARLPDRLFHGDAAAGAAQLWVFLITIPFWTNLLIRTCAIMLIIRDEGLINNRADRARRDRPADPDALHQLRHQLGLLYVFLPFMVLPLYASLEKLDFRLVEAGYDLYATRRQGAVADHHPAGRSPASSPAAILVFIPALGAYVTPLILGGGKHLMIGNLIAQQFGSGRNWPLGSAQALILMAVVLVALLSSTSRNTPATKIRAWLMRRADVRHQATSRASARIAIVCVCRALRADPDPDDLLASTPAARSPIGTAFSLDWYRQALAQRRIPRRGRELADHRRRARPSSRPSAPRWRRSARRGSKP